MTKSETSVSCTNYTLIHFCSFYIFCRDVSSLNLSGESNSWNCKNLKLKLQIETEGKINVRKGELQIRTNSAFQIAVNFLVGLFFPCDTRPIPLSGNSKHANSEHTDTGTDKHQDTHLDRQLHQQTEQVETDCTTELKTKGRQNTRMKDCGHCTLKCIGS